MERLIMIPPVGWVRVHDVEVPTWINEDGAVLQYSLQTPPSATRGCTVEAHRAWTVALLGATVFAGAPVTDVTAETCAFGVVAGAVKRAGEGVTSYWYLHDRDALGVFVSLQSRGAQADLEAGRAFVRSLALAPLAVP